MLRKKGIGADEATRMVLATRETLEKGKENNRGTVSKAVHATKDAVYKGIDETNEIMEKRASVKEFNALKEDLRSSYSERKLIDQSRREGLSIKETRQLINDERKKSGNANKAIRDKQRYENDFKEQLTAAAADFDRNMAEIRLAKSGALDQANEKRNKGRTEAEKIDVGSMSDFAAQQKALLDQGMSRNEIIEAMAKTRVDILQDYDAGKEFDAEAKERKDNRYQEYLETRDDVKDIGKTADQIERDKRE